MYRLEALAKTLGLQSEYTAAHTQHKRMPKIVHVDPAAKGSFKAAFVLPITRDGHAMLTWEKRGKALRYGMLGGKAKPEETDYQCMAREAKEETNGALSDNTILRIAGGRGIIEGSGNAPNAPSKVYYENAKAWAIKHDLVVPEDLELKAQFEPEKATELCTPIKKKKRTLSMGIEFVPLTKLRDFKWRGENMHHCASVLCARLLK